MVAKCLDGQPNSPGRSFQVQWQWREPSTVSDKFRAQHSKFLGSRALRTLNHLESPRPTVTMTSRSSQAEHPSTKFRAATVTGQSEHARSLA